MVDESFGKCNGQKYENLAWEKSLWVRFSTNCTTPAEKCHSFTVTMFHSHPAEVVDEYFGKCDGEKYENAVWEKSL